MLCKLFDMLLTADVDMTPEPAEDDVKHRATILREVALRLLATRVLVHRVTRQNAVLN